MDFSASFPLSETQQLITHLPMSGTTFLEGPAGCGKTTAGVNRLLFLINQGVPAESILILVPQRTLAFPYYQALNQFQIPPGGVADIVTLGGLGQRMIDLFWPIVAKSAGFNHPEQPPVFLTLETAQYYLSRIVTPLREQGFFESVKIDPNRLLSQILDNLNKSAGVGFDYLTIADRLTSAWVGDETQPHIYRDAQTCANDFRQYCLTHNLLDFSLQLEIFANHLWKSHLIRSYLSSRYRHLIYDNIEEDIPVAHDIIRDWLPQFDSALLIYDKDGGYRAFLGADPLSGYSLKNESHTAVTLDQTFVMTPPVAIFSQLLRESVYHKISPVEVSSDYTAAQIYSASRVIFQSHFPEMIDWVANETRRLVYEEDIPPKEIVILAPFLSDSLRFTLENRLGKHQVAVRSSRPSRSLGDEPATRCLLTLAKLAHPQWKLLYSSFDLRYVLMQSITNLDLVRAELLVKIVYTPNQTDKNINSFNQIKPEMQERITYIFGERYERLRQWLINYQSQEPTELDVFFSHLFGEVLSQPGFTFHDNYDSATVASRLIESIQKFRRANQPTRQGSTGCAATLGQEYIQMVEERVVAAQYLGDWQDQSIDAVLLAPATTFLMNNRPARYQFWLDIGSVGWWERLMQPLTHPQVLSRHWLPNQIWTDQKETETNQYNLARQVSGLLHRCRDKVYLCAAGVNEQGNEQRGHLVQTIQFLTRQFPNPEAKSG